MLQLLSWQRLVTWGSDRWARCIDYRATIAGNGVTTNPNTNPHRRRHTHAAILLLGNYCKPIEMFLCPSHPSPHQSSILSIQNTCQFFGVDYRIVKAAHRNTRHKIYVIREVFLVASLSKSTSEFYSGNNNRLVY
jgi:hypothetical protein